MGIERGPGHEVRYVQPPARLGHRLPWVAACLVVVLTWGKLSSESVNHCLACLFRLFYSEDRPRQLDDDGDGDGDGRMGAARLATAIYYPTASSIIVIAFVRCYKLGSETVAGPHLRRNVKITASTI